MDGENRAGLVTLCIWARPGNNLSQSDVMNRHFVELEKAMLQPKEAPWIVVSGNSPIKNVVVADIQGSIEPCGLTLFTAAMEFGEAWVVVGLVSPDRETLPAWWAINKRAFEIVQQSFELG